MKKKSPKLSKTSIVPGTYLPSGEKGEISFDDYGVIFTPDQETPEVKKFIVRYDEIIDAVQESKLFKPKSVVLTTKKSGQYKLQSPDATGIIKYLFDKF